MEEMKCPYCGASLLLFEVYTTGYLKHHIMQNPDTNDIDFCNEAIDLLDRTSINVVCDGPVEHSFPYTSYGNFLKVIEDAKKEIRLGLLVE